MAKIYTVVKDGTVLKELKTLTAAKKLADAEGAEVLCEGERVYQGIEAPVSDPVVQTATDAHTAEEKTEKQADQKPSEKYMLLRKMNVRKAPSLNAEKLKVLDTGAVVEVSQIKDDWLCLTDGSFILFEDGKNAKRI